MSFGSPKVETPPPPAMTPTMADANRSDAGGRERRRSLINRGLPSMATQPLNTRATTGKRTLIGGS